MVHSLQYGRSTGYKSTWVAALATLATLAVLTLWGERALTGWMRSRAEREQRMEVCIHWRMPRDQVAVHNSIAGTGDYLPGDLSASSWRGCEQLAALDPRVPAYYMSVPYPVVYLHGRQNVHGVRLVALVLDGEEGDQLMHLNGAVYELSWLGRLRRLSVTSVTFGRMPTPGLGSSSYNLYGGQEDARDNSLFHVSYDLSKESDARGDGGILDGRLCDDETIQLSVRGGLLAGAPIRHEVRADYGPPITFHEGAGILDPAPN